MRIRQIDDDSDWLYGKGKNNYVRDNAAVIQNSNTRLSSFLGDCFFDLGGGLDWFNLLGGKDETALSLAIAAVILNTRDVTGLLQLSIQLDVERRLTIQYRVQTTYSVASSTFQYDLNGIG